MKNIFYLLFALMIIAACKNAGPEGRTNTGGDAMFDSLMNNYWEERMQLFPFEATSSGDNRYNDKMTITIAESFRDSLKRFYSKYQQSLDAINKTTLNEGKQVSYDVFAYEMQMNLEGLKYPSHYMPINQFWAFTLELPQMSSGEGNQPFKTTADYDNFLKRMHTFPAWVDTAIYNMRKGIANGWVLPKTLVVKMLPQLKAMVVTDAKQSIFYGPVKLMPANFSDADKQKYAAQYVGMIDSIVIPSYSKLYTFIDKEYLPASRSTCGIGGVNGGDAYYAYLVKYWTTTNLTPDSIYKIGQAEVARLEGEMNRVKDEVGYKGSLKEFFEFLGKDKQFYPFTTAKEVLDSFQSVHDVEEPYLAKMFKHRPKTPFVIRQTEAFRAASASAEYNPGSEDGSRSGIFYVPILNAKKFNAVGMETLFLHEAIPGHHYQISLQQESGELPKFRKFLWYGAYGEGWALYSETLGKELGLYKNPYQYFGHLSDGIHRAIRLVVDVGMHAKGMTREEAVAYMMAHERISEEEATAEIERYMAIPGQALGYKIGALKIREIRNKYQQQLGDKFKLAAFHDAVL
ncbi:MAG: DUF885 domain-containing protein, partial [Sphingobacteriales bacterium]